VTSSSYALAGEEMRPRNDSMGLQKEGNGKA
jgi:hypothetical protein